MELKIMILATMVFGCATTGERMQNLSLGMSKSQVEREIGRSDGAEVVDSRQCFIYLDRLISGWGMNRADYRICFEDGRLAEYKAIAVRERKPTASTLLIHQF